MMTVARRRRAYRAARVQSGGPSVMSAAFVELAAGAEPEPRRWRANGCPPSVAGDRRVISAGAAGLAEAVRLKVGGGTTLPQAHCASPQIFFPLADAFALQVEGREHLCDVNQMGWLKADAVTQDRALMRGDIRFLIVTLTPDLAERVAFAPDRSEARPAPAAAQRLAHLLAERAGDTSEALWTEEALLTLLRTATGFRPKTERDRGRARRLVEAVKALLAASDETLSLTAIAAAVGASPAYLTDLFRSVEGLPIARYQQRLRLARALRALPDTEDITGLALDLGFSSHSHFSAAFRSVYGLSPSEHRAEARAGGRARRAA